MIRLVLKERIERYEMANSRSLNFSIQGILGEGVAASSRVDGQAKSPGEYLRAKYIDVPVAIAPQQTQIHTEVEA